MFYKIQNRGRFYLDVSTFWPSCKPCHDGFHTTRQEWAKRMGLMVNPASTAPCPPVSKVFLPYDLPDQSDASA